MLKKIISVVLCLGMIFALTACSSSKKPKEAPPIIINDGQFSEMQVIHQMVKMLVEEHTDLKVTIKDEMSPTNSYNEMVKGNADIMNSYDGTLLTTFLKLDTKDITEGKTLYEFTNEKSMEKNKLRLLNKLGTNNTYAIAVPQPIADKYKLNTVSDLIPVANELIFGAEHEFFGEEGSMKYTPFVAFYGLKFKEGKPIDIGLKYSAVESGNIDVTVAYATDGLNKKAMLKILEDDMKFFPEYNGALLVRDDLFERYRETAPNLEEVLNKLGDSMTDAVMVDLTYQIDVDGKTAETVAKEFLKTKGLIA